MLQAVPPGRSAPPPTAGHRQAGDQTKQKARKHQLQGGTKTKIPFSGQKLVWCSRRHRPVCAQAPAPHICPRGSRWLRRCQEATPRLHTQHRVTINLKFNAWYHNSPQPASIAEGQESILLTPAGKERRSHHQNVKGHSPVVPD